MCVHSENYGLVIKKTQFTHSIMTGPLERIMQVKATGSNNYSVMFDTCSNHFSEKLSHIYPTMYE